METKKAKMTDIARGIAALGRLTELRLSTWGKTREVAKLNRAVVTEAEAYNAELDRLRAEYPDGGGEYEARLQALVTGEVELPAVALGEGDFPGELPTPADVSALGGLIDFE